MSEDLSYLDAPKTILDRLARGNEDQGTAAVLGQLSAHAQPNDTQGENAMQAAADLIGEILFLATIASGDIEFGGPRKEGETEYMTDAEAEAQLHAQKTLIEAEPEIRRILGLKVFDD